MSTPSCVAQATTQMQRTKVGMRATPSFVVARYPVQQCLYIQTAPNAHRTSSSQQTLVSNPHRGPLLYSSDPINLDMDEKRRSSNLIRCGKMPLADQTCLLQPDGFHRQAVDSKCHSKCLLQPNGFHIPLTIHRSTSGGSKSASDSAPSASGSVLVALSTAAWSSPVESWV